MTIRAVTALGFAGAATVAFCAEAFEDLRPACHRLKERTPPLQLEHPGTEAVTIVDLGE